jgi:hypothetical protein
VKIGFSKDGLTLNSKKFHPLNFKTKNISLESDIPLNNVDALDLLSAIQGSDIRSASREDGIKLLKLMLEQFK